MPLVVDPEKQSKVETSRNSTGPSQPHHGVSRAAMLPVAHARGPRAVPKV